MKLKYTFALIFGTPIIIINFIATYVFFIEAREELVENQVEHLTSITETKRTRVGSVFDQKRRLLQLIANNLPLDTSITESNFSNNKDSFERFLEESNRLSPFIEEFALTDSLGNVLLSTNLDFTEKFRPVSAGMALQDSFLYVGDHFYTFQDENYHVISSSVPNSENALFVFQSMSNIDTYTSTYTGLGETGETILVDEEGSYLTDTRFGQEGRGVALDLINKLEDNDRIFASITGFDYRNEKVFAVGTKIPGTENLFLYTKMDIGEVYAPVTVLRNRLMLIDLLVSIVAVAVGLLVGNYLSKRLNKIIISLKKIKEGELSFRGKVKSRTELGEVEETLNEVASEIEKTFSLLQSSNEALNKYAYIVAHDIKSPTQNIYSLSQILKEEYESQLGKEGKEIIEMLSEKSQSLQELVSQILASAKKGFSEEERKVVDVEKLLVKTLSDMHIPDHFEVELQKPLPKVLFNHLLLYQVFQNLISNAIKYNDKEEGVVSICGKRHGTKILFEVKDNGSGIPEHLQSKIFEMFGKAHTDAEKESYGIGLATVKRIITGNDGTIWVESEPGKGTTFFFTVPGLEDEVL